MGKRIARVLQVSVLLWLVIACNTISPPVVNRIDEQGFQHLVRQREGKVLVVNIWATWCEPCRREFSQLVRLAEIYQHSDVEIVGISADYADELHSKILPFLQSQQVNFVNYVKSVQDDEAFINIINPDWSGALPATAIYDASGRQRYFHSGSIHLHTLQKQIEAIR